MLTIRPARWSDRVHVWRLRNAPDVRRWMVTTDAIAYWRHLWWYAGVMWWDDHEQLLVARYFSTRIGMIIGMFAGYVRLTRTSPESATLSVAVDADCRGFGYGQQLIRSACAYAARHGVINVTAQIRIANHASRNAFAAAGFIETGRSQEWVWMGRVNSGRDLR